MRENRESSRPFQRELPGGGYVAIEVTRNKPAWRDSVYDGRVVVERRAAARRDGHEPPVIARASGANMATVVDRLFPTAQSNATIGAALLRRQPA